MTATVVPDASALVALLVGEPEVGDFMAAVCKGAHLAAPHLMPFEVSNVLRRHERAGLLDATATRLAHQDLLDLPVQYWPYDALAERVRELHTNLTAYDAAYVAVAETLDAPLVTLDSGISRAPGIRCALLVPPRSSARR